MPMVCVCLPSLVDAVLDESLGGSVPELLRVRVRRMEPTARHTGGPQFGQHVRGAGRPAADDPEGAAGGAAHGRRECGDAQGENVL